MAAPPLTAPAHVASRTPNPISLTRYLVEEQRADRINPELRLLIEVVARACKTISVAVGKGALGGVLGSRPARGTCRAKCRRSSTSSPTRCCSRPTHGAATWPAWRRRKWTTPADPRRYPRGEYLLLFDPLDGCSNIDVNVSIGTIFSVLRCPKADAMPDDEHFLQPGTAQVAAGYCIYGPRPCWC